MVDSALVENAVLENALLGNFPIDSALVGEALSDSFVITGDFTNIAGDADRLIGNRLLGQAEIVDDKLLSQFQRIAGIFS